MIRPQEADCPLTQKVLRQHGVNLKELGASVLQVVAALAKCDAKVLTISFDRKPSATSRVADHFTVQPGGVMFDPRERADRLSRQFTVVLTVAGVPGSVPAP